ncbi:MAG: hypothetical protein NTU85_01785 [Candidatus Kaiserbacteria bacterium]|nr:hypothetical protein [Candidatus Kaiserbacteria bacterium]
MAYLIFILVSLALLIGFFILSDHEGRHGTRFFARERVRLDEQVERAEFILTNVNLGSFLRGEIRSVIQRITHDVAHLSLQAVRTVERLLTRIVRYLRTQRAIDTVPRENAREFVKTLSDFKDQLKESPPEIPDILN